MRFNPIDNVHHCIVVSNRSLVEKKEDLVALSILCTIRSFKFARVLCDLGTSINLMPLVVYKQLGLGAPKPTYMRLLMVDRTVTWSVVVLCDVLVKMASFNFPINFVILDYEVDFQVPIILGRPFLATDRALVDMELDK